MSTMTYKGYAARIEYSDEDGCFIGHIAGINDVIGFHAESVKELRPAFEEAVYDYLVTCAKINPRFRRVMWISFFIGISLLLTAKIFVSMKGV